MTGLSNTAQNGHANSHANGYSNGHSNGHSKDTLILNDQIPISPNAPQEVPRLLNEIASHDLSFFQYDQKARFKLLEDARSLVNALETPRESMIRYCWAQVCPFDYIVHSNTDVVIVDHLRCY